MLYLKKILFLLLLFSFSTLFSQEKPENKKIIISGNVSEKSSNLSLEYVTISILKPNSKLIVSGGVTDLKGNFSIEITPGNYDLKFEYATFKKFELKSKSFFEDTKLQPIKLEEAINQLEDVVIRADKTTIDIKLDKKIYNVGKDIIVRGGTASDVLNNVPSVAVDVDGNVSLRGNEGVRILIDGKPSNSSNIADALRQIPADAVDKVEVVTNPSSRYDAEGGGGILNIMLKKGKNQGFNSTSTFSVGSPENTSATVNLNLKSEQFNLFSTLGYGKRKNPGTFLIDQENFNASRVLQSAVKERRSSDKYGSGPNINFGIELFLTKNASWTNSLNYRNNKGGNAENILYSNYDENLNFINTRQRFNDAITLNENIEYASNFVQKFKKEGHKLSFDAVFSIENEGDDAAIEGKILETNAFVSSENSHKKNIQSRNLFQADYVLPFNENTQIEAGVKANFVTLLADYKVQERITPSSPFTNISAFTNTLQYKENITAVYTQFGSKVNKFSYLVGLRFENSQIEINQFVGDISKSKNYQNFFPSMFFTYELSKTENISLNYSKRITRPRDRFINPFSSYTSNTNLFQGNPDINPSYSDAFDLGYLKKWDKITLSTSIYYNHSTQAFQVVRLERGDFVNGIPVILNTPFNLATDDKTGFEFTLNYNFKKWWKLNGNFNFFNGKTTGDFSYTNTNNKFITQSLNSNTQTWFTRITSKITLPYKIEWQSNITYNAAANQSQGKSPAIASANVAFSKDVLKEKATISFNVSDLFNTRKMIRDLQLPTVNSYSEMQPRMRQFTLSFTYRFNKKKTEKETKPRQSEEDNMQG
jgi:outer membrane receptor for ferrienterochelin and colicins